MADRSSSSVPSLIGGAVASGVTTALVAPSRMSPAVRRSLHVGLGLTSGAAVVQAMARPDGPGSEQPVPPMPARLGLGVGLGSLVALGSAAGMALDMMAERALVRRGVRHPRLWIGLGAAGLTAAMSWVEPRVATDDESTA